MPKARSRAHKLKFQLTRSLVTDNQDALRLVLATATAALASRLVVGCGDIQLSLLLNLTNPEGLPHWIHNELQKQKHGLF